MSELNINSLAIIVRSAPFSSAHGQEALEAAINGLNFDMQVTLVFMHDGVFQIKAEQSGLGLKDYSKSWRAMPDYGIESVLVHDLSLTARGLDASNLILESKLANRDQIAAVISDHQQVLVF